MSRKPFRLGHCHNRGANGVQAVPRQALDRHAFHKAQHRQSTIGAGVAIGRQDVVGAAGIISGWLGRKRPKKYRTRVPDFRQLLNSVEHLLSLQNLQQQ